MGRGGFFGMILGWTEADDTIFQCVLLKRVANGDDRIFDDKFGEFSMRNSSKTSQISLLLPSFLSI